MRTSPRNTPFLVSCQWQTLAPTRELYLHSLYHSAFPDSSVSHSNGSQFFITTVTTGWLDGKHVVFGEVADKESLKVVKAIEATGSTSGKVQYKEPVITKAGQQ